VLDSGAPWQAAYAALAGLVAGLALLALVAGLRSRAATERPIGARRSRLALVPWELVVLGAAGACYLALRGGDAVRLDDGIAQVSTLVVAFPLLFLVGSAILLVRLLAALLPRVAKRAGRFGPAAYLAANRIAGARLVSVVLLAAASAPIAMVVYAAGMTGTANTTLDAKARVIAGADLAVLTVDPLRRTPATDAAGTVVIRYLYGKVEGQNDDVAVLAVDPDTFVRTAYWDRRFGPESLDELMARLRGPAPAGEVPAVVVRDGAAFRDRFSVGLGKTTITARTVGSAELFPGRRLRQPMMIVDRSRLPEVDPYAGTTNELWTNGDPARAQAALRAQDAAVFFAPKDRAAVFDTANFVGVSWTFGYLTALAALVGLVAVGGLLLYLETRQRSRVASYALGRRMGLTRRIHLRSLLAELTALAVPAWAIGTGLAWTAVLMVHERVDIDPGRPPASLLTVPLGALAGSAVAVAVVVVLAALYAQRAADRARAAEVLRLT
jgi:putative ABC transport system permease protein